MKKAFYLILAIMLTCFTSPVYSFERVDNFRIIMEKYDEKNPQVLNNSDEAVYNPVNKKKKGKKGKILDNNIENNLGVYATILFVLSGIYLVVGFVIMDFNEIMGLVFLVAAIIWLILGFIVRNKAIKAKKNQMTSESNSFKDVVYLKNGSVVKGIIIEQIPNESLKIETGDGSIFVYKMNEVEKIGKEKQK